MSGKDYHLRNYARPYALSVAQKRETAAPVSYLFFSCLTAFALVSPLGKSFGWTLLT